jgi:hypothetical protein
MQMGVGIRKKQNVRYAVIDMVFSNMMIKYATHFGVNIQKMYPGQIRYNFWKC